MTQPSDQLDELIENWRTDKHDQHIRVGSRLPSLPPTSDAAQSSRRPRQPADEPGQGSELRELLETAQQLDRLPTLRPDAAFARHLEQHLQSRAAAMRAPGQRQAAPATISRKKRPLLAWARVHPAWAAVVMALAFLGILGVIGVAGAEASSPDNPFYQVKLFEQGVRLTFASQADRIRLHISYAQDDLSELQQHTSAGDDNTYLQTLQYLQQETSEAASALASLPAGQEHDQLAQMLAQLTASEQQTLRSLLPSLDITERLATTQALADLGTPTPTIRSVVVTAGADGKSTVVITGAGFQPGASLLVDGQVVSASVEVTQTQLKATLALAADARPQTFGVSNPDGTVAQSNQIQWASATPTPEPTNTPTGEPTHGPGDHPTPTPGRGNHGTPTPEPQPTETPSPHH